MFQYLVRRGAISLVTLLLITFVVYALMRNIPGTPLTVDMAMMNPGRMASTADDQAIGTTLRARQAVVRGVFHLAGKRGAG